MTEEPEIYYNKTTGTESIEVPFMSKVVMTELYDSLKPHNISRDAAVIMIWKSDLSDQEKIIIGINLGEYKQKTRYKRCVVLRYYKIRNWAVNTLKQFKDDIKV